MFLQFCVIYSHECVNNDAVVKILLVCGLKVLFGSVCVEWGIFSF